MDHHTQNNPLVAVGFLGSLGSGMLATVETVGHGSGTLIPLAGIIASVLMPVLVEYIRAGKALTIANERAAALQHQLDEVRSNASLQRQLDEMRVAAAAASAMAASASVNAVSANANAKGHP